MTDALDFVPDELRPALGALWGKSDAGGRMNLLLQHLFDTAAVAELMWDHYLPPVFRERIDAATKGRGRLLFTWLCAMHDVGKATPAFQFQVPGLGEAVVAAGLDRGPLSPRAARQWRHEWAGAKILHDVLGEAGWADEHLGWFWPLIAGHHGAFPTRSLFNAPAATGHPHGRTPSWRVAQHGLVLVVSDALGLEDLSAAQPVVRPARADQLALSGWVVMADWIASDETNFEGIDRLSDAGFEAARTRAAKAWAVLGIRRGWANRLSVPTGDVVEKRFGFASRPLQTLVVDAARRVPEPALFIVEAPMGEGKTEAALAATEVLAERFGADGLFIGMPTQATSDPMFRRVLAWSRQVADAVQVTLLHGKRMFNKDWRSLTKRAPQRRVVEGPDQYGMNDDIPSYANVDEGGDHLESGGDEGPAEWFLGPKRGLLSPLALGTIDQLLFAATRTRHVMLRYAGLAAKIVVLDEIHAADVYMLQFVDEALRWLGQGRVPVILLSATLPPDQRREMIASYLQGAIGDPHFSAENLSAADGYPRVTAAWAEAQTPRYLVSSTPGWRESQGVSVDVLTETPEDSAAAVERLLSAELASGGCALVIRNTVRRAQDTYKALRAKFGTDVVLLHGRLAAGHRAERTERVLSLLGPPSPDTRRPHRLIVVATQLAEQSFDVDVDLLITDLAPIDLLLQRVGRLHRHARDQMERPPRLRTARVVVTGVGSLDEGPPWVPRGSTAVYPEYHLLRAAALVRQAARSDGWSIPADVPRLVEAAYGEQALVPEAWADAEAEAAAELKRRNEARKAQAELHVLVARDEWSKQTLEGLHRLHARGTRSDEDMRAVVRDGPDTIEVVLLRHGDGGYAALDGTPLGIHGEAGSDVVDHVLAGMLRLPPRFTAAAKDLTTLAEWKDRPWLRFWRVVVTDAMGRGQIGDHPIRYDEELGLVEEVAASGWPVAGKAGTT